MSDQNNKPVLPQAPQSKKPNEVSGFTLSSAIKITDPNTKQVLVQKRAD